MSSYDFFSHFTFAQSKFSHIVWMKIRGDRCIVGYMCKKQLCMKELFFSFIWWLCDCEAFTCIAHEERKIQMKMIACEKREKQSLRSFCQLIHREANMLDVWQQGLQAAPRLHSLMMSMQMAHLYLHNTKSIYDVVYWWHFPLSSSLSLSLSPSLSPLNSFFFHIDW